MSKRDAGRETPQGEGHGAHHEAEHPVVVGAALLQAVVELGVGDAVTQQVGGGAPRSLWSFDTAAPLVDLVDHPSFLGRHYARSVLEGDLVAFSCGATGSRVHGIAVVTGVCLGAGESSGDGRVSLQVMCINGPSRAPTKLKVAS